MKLYLLIHEQDMDSAWGTDVTAYTELCAAQKAMRQAYRESIKVWAFNETVQTEEHECSFLDKRAIIRDNTETESWRIEEQEVNIQVAVEVAGGIVQSVYSTADVSVEVYDLDVSDFPDEAEQNEAHSKAAALEELKNNPIWRSVW